MSDALHQMWPSVGPREIARMSSRLLLGFLEMFVVLYQELLPWKSSFMPQHCCYRSSHANLEKVRALINDFW